jgi:hypothetical protein
MVTNILLRKYMLNILLLLLLLLNAYNTIIVYGYFQKALIKFKSLLKKNSRILETPIEGLFTPPASHANQSIYRY